MKDNLTSEVEFISQFDELAAEIYVDKKYYYLTFEQIATLRQMPLSEAKSLYAKCRKLLRDRDSAPFYTLSNRAKAALIINKYKSATKLIDDVMNEKVDLECLPRIGHKVAVEIRKWCVRNRD